MEICRTPETPAAKPCMRDMSQLIYRQLGGPAAIKNMTLDRLQERVQEEVAADNRYAEEGPLLVEHEEKRRQPIRPFLMLDMVEDYLPNRA